MTISELDAGSTFADEKNKKHKALLQTAHTYPIY
jgi:hypothetical protein